MFKFYKIRTVDGDFKVISVNKHIALIKAYNKYKKSRKNTSFKKFKSIIIDVYVNE